ncbi:molybdopterin converting factor subunit 1 [uncultured Paraglaciecola sp.]|uniref:molybdopterin converting factor subunit 1 n=1 Tax=uncultured Paraglaciecola sp. TaxID=1765024 RepID=UPI00263136A0|nr:molybdopterin converting factor subunit 1 [uncultured Paraglaciecola sp.]
MLKILFFGQLKDVLKTDELKIELVKGASAIETVAMLRETLQLKGELWQEYMAYGKALVAVNQEISKETAPLKAGDEIAFFPPVTGG